MSGAIWSQSITNQPTEEELIVLTKSKHDALRKDIDDYRNLLIKYQSVKIEYDVVVADLERQTKTSGKTFDELKKANLKIVSLENEVSSLRNEIYDLNSRLSDLDKSYKRLDKMYYTEKGKVHRLKKGQAEVYAWKGAALFFFLCIFIVAGNN